MATKIKSGVIGTLDSNLVFADNSKAVFGAGSDLQIYHSGSESRIDENGAGNLKINADNLEIYNSASSEAKAKFNTNGSVTLYYDNASKLATTSTGIDVTGTVVSTSNTATQFKNATDTDIQHKFETNSSSDFAIHRLIGSDGVDNKFIIGYGPNHPSTPNHIALKNTHASGSLGFNTGAASIERMRIDSSGRLLIGGTSATFGVLGVESSGNCTADFFSNSGSSTAAKTELFFSGGISGNSHVSFASIVAEQAAGNEATRKGQLRFLTANSGGPQTAMTIIANGNVGIGITPTEGKLHVKSDGAGEVELLTLENSTGTNGKTTLTFKTTSTDATKSAQIFAERINASGHTDLAFRTYNGSTTEAVRIDHDGNVGIGTNSPSELLHIKSTGDAVIRLQADSDNANEDDNAYILFEQDGGLVTGYIGYDTDTNDITVANEHTGSDLTFKTQDIERMRIDGAGMVLVGTTSKAVGIIGDVNGFGVSADGGPNNPVVAFADSDATVNANSVIQEISFKNDTSFTAFYTKFTDRDGVQGTISGSGTGSVSFNTTSDERLKENIVNTTNKLDKIKQIQVKDFNYIGKDVTTTGLIAQELNEIIPDVVREGSEDAAKDPWAVDYGKLTPYLVKAIQEQQTLIESLTARIETLEG